MERSIRIGKDFNVRWSIHRVVDGERQPYVLAGKELVLQYRTPYGLKEATEWKTEGNTIVWTFRGREQEDKGAYELILTENGGKDGMVTVDTCRAFKLVAHSCEETEGSGSDIVIEDVVLESEVAFAALRGPQGERGPEGPQGPQGPQGPKGEDGYDDTEIQAKLTELSANRGLFIAVYNETSLEEIQEAFSKKMTCVCLYVGNYYLLSEKTDKKAIFRGFNGDKEYYQLTRTTKQWLASSSQYESTMNKTQSISENSTSTQYPSAKAVYEALQNVGGGEGSYDDTEIKNDIADLQAKDTQHDAKLTELSEETSELNVIINGKPQETLEWQAEGFYDIGSQSKEGDALNTNVQSQALYRTMLVSCNEGDSFLINIRCVVAPFAFVDENNRLLAPIGVPGTRYIGQTLVAPKNAVKVIIQTTYSEWVELGSILPVKVGSTGIKVEAEKIKDAVKVTEDLKSAEESIQAFANLGVSAMKLNNVFSYGNFANTSVWTARANTSVAFSNGIAKLAISGTNLTIGIATSKASEINVTSNSKVFFAIRIRTNQENTLFGVNINGTTYQEFRSTITINKDADWEWRVIEWTPTSAYTASYLVLQATRQGANMTSDAWVEIKDFIVAVYGKEDAMTADKFTSLLQSQDWFFGSVVIPNAERFIALDSQIRKDVVVSVGEGGDFQSLNAAMAYISQFYPMYKYDGIKAEIRILNGTIITDQVLVVGADYSWMTITYEGYNPDSLTYDNVAESIAKGTIVFDSTSGYKSVAVDASSWKGVTHDTRGDVCLFRAEDGGRLPKIKCVFKLTNKGEYDVAGICCNRGSSCVVATLCGFIGFNDGVIANNESSITIREGITMNCGRWGCHARHNGEVSARSVIAVGCATDAKYSGESAALCSDRIADLDGREAWVSCGNAFAVRNASRMNCNGTHILGSADETAIIYATAVGVGNFTSLYIDAGVKIDHSQGAMLSVSEYTFRESYVFNDVTNKGIIYK